MLSMQFVVAPFQRPDFDDTASGIGTAGQSYRLEVPTFRRLGQFEVYILPLQEQGFCTSFYHRGRQSGENRKRRHGAGRNDVHPTIPPRDEIFRTAMMDGCGGPADP